MSSFLQRTVVLDSVTCQRYYFHVRQQRLFLVLLTPSFASFICSLALAGGLLSATGWQRIANYPVVHDYLSLGAILQNAPDGVSAFFRSLSAESITYNLILLGIALAISLVVYIVLTIGEHGLAGLLESILRMRFAGSGSRATSVEKDLSRRASVRAFVFICWLGYIVLFAKLVLPFCLVAFHLAFDGRHAINWQYGLLALAVLTAAFHVHVVFIRLLYLRARLFGSDAALTAGLE